MSSMLRCNNPKIYEKFHGMQGRDTIAVLTQYRDKVDWKLGKTVLDIGCGPGDLTANYVLPLLPKEGKVIGVDISTAMVQHAKIKYTDERIKFEKMDITNVNETNKYRNNFDLALSFYCMNWIQDQLSAIKNVNKMLISGGEILFIFLADNPIYYLYEQMASNNRWQPYMKDYKEAISPYHWSVDPVTDVKNILENAGFHVNECYSTKESYSFPSEDLLFKSIKAVDPFMNRIPTSLKKEYVKDILHEIRRGNLCEINSDKSIAFTYSLITVHAIKPIMY